MLILNILIRLFQPALMGLERRFAAGWLNTGPSRTGWSWDWRIVRGQ